MLASDCSPSTSNGLPKRRELFFRNLKNAGSCPQSFKHRTQVSKGGALVTLRYSDQGGSGDIEIPATHPGQHRSLTVLQKSGSDLIVNLRPTCLPGLVMCVYICVHICKNMCVTVCVYMCTCIVVCAIYACMCLQECLCLYVHVCVCASVCVCLFCAHMHTCTHT